MREFRRIAVWGRGHRLALDVYGATRRFPREEVYGLTAQLRRCSASIVSIPANIAEGCGRGGDAELRRFMLIAMGSSSELEYHLRLAHDLGLLNAEIYRTLSKDTQQVKRMLSTFIKKLQVPRQKS